ncbi:MAG: family 10 glycosylhydrolase [Candidatus Sumerlaeia bacterium]|nr:family 10 glycosylhydrolase [Candidatus Sumerlaeia bacterium]
MKRRSGDLNRLRRLWLAALVGVAVSAVVQCCALRLGPPPRIAADKQTIKDRALRSVEARAIWVTRWDYKTPAEVRWIIANCARTNFNIIFFQVRGNATVFYRSALEPWAWELTSDGPATTGQDPGFDPLAIAVSQAHRRGIELHAYMNVFPGWRSQDYPPPEAGQLWTAHPDWFMADREGNKMIPRDRDTGPHPDWYAFVNPAMPEVRDHIAAVFREVAENYDVDGIHLDYCRYPSEVGDFSYDPTSLRRFREQTGKAPHEAPELWTQWRGRQVTETAARIYDECKAANPHLMLSASLARDPVHDRDHLMRCGLEWMAAGKLDAACPMIYTTKNEEVAQSVTQYLLNSHGRLVLAGLMVKANDPTLALEQISIARAAGAHGVALFSYSAVFPRHRPGAVAVALKEGPFRQPARVPMPAQQTAAPAVEDEECAIK